MIPPVLIAFAESGYAVVMLEGRPTLIQIREMPQRELTEFVAAYIQDMVEDEALAVMANSSCTTQLCDRIAKSSRLTSHESIRARLVEHRASPQSQALKYIHYLYWSDLVRISANVQVSPAVRKAIDARLLVIVTTMTRGEKIAAAKRCARELLNVFLFDEDPKVFESVLINSRLTEDDLVRLISSDQAIAHQLVMVAGDQRWSGRYPIRRALVLNPRTPNAVAASQLRYLKRDDLSMLIRRVATSVYLRRCIERMGRERDR